MAIDPTDLPDYRTPAELRRDLAAAARRRLRTARSLVDSPRQAARTIALLVGLGAVLAAGSVLLTLAEDHHGRYLGLALHEVVVLGGALAVRQPLASWCARVPALRALVVVPVAVLVAAAVPGVPLGVCLAVGAGCGVVGVLLLHHHRSLRPEVVQHPSELPDGPAR